MINLSTPIVVSDMTLTLDITGGYDGDFYAYLRHTDARGEVGFSVLLNRIGVASDNPYGSPAPGMDVTFDDRASTRIDLATSAAGQPLTGTYQPDGLLSSFDGMAANGAWDLFVADESTPDQGTLESWSLTITGGKSAVSVPEGGNSALMLLGGCSVLALASSCRFAMSTNIGVERPSAAPAGVAGDFN
jgi:hypothetical protein